MKLFLTAICNEDNLLPNSVKKLTKA